MRPLEGVRAIDIGVAVAGPIAGHVLADMGAEVIRVEPPLARPVAGLHVAPRAEGAPDRPHNRIVLFNEFNRSKLGLTLDLTKRRGREVFLRLVAISDLVIENMSPRVLPELRLDYPHLREAREDIILVSMPAFGGTGPLRDRISYGPGIDAMSGLAWLTGYPDRGPLKPGNYYCDQNAGLLAAFAALAALRHRARSGRGQHVELSMLEGEIQLVGEALIDYVMNGRVQGRIGNQHPCMAPHGAYPCAGEDRWVAIAVGSDEEWRALCEVMGQPELASDERFADVVSRVRHRDEADAIVGAWTRGLEHGEAQQRLQAAGVPAGAALTTVELLEDRQLRARGYFRTIEHAEAGVSPHGQVAWRLSATPSPPERPAPCLGEHNDLVLKGLLGMSDAEVAQLAEERVIASERRQEE
jgi:crotonobetainyl-CoA:carnitine CoA-transferase CaiB-like acyl-CoA transferase